jgi:hypothetical protein
MTILNIELTGEQIFYNLALLCAMAVAIFSLWKSTNSKSWPSTNGKVISVEAKVFHNRDNGASGTIDFPVDIKYSYRIQGRDFIGSSINAGLPNVFSYEKDQAEFIEDYPSGKSIDVYYNPKNSTQSALKVWSLTAFQQIAIWIFLSFVGMIFFITLNLFLHPSNPIDKFMSKITGS